MKESRSNIEIGGGGRSRTRLLIPPSDNLVSYVHQNFKRRNSQVHEKIPEDREHDSLTSIRNDPRLQSTTEQTQQSIRSHNIFGGDKVSNLALVNLAISLDDAQGVRDGIRDQGGAKPDECSSR